MATLEYANGIKSDCQRIVSDEFEDWLEKTTSSTNYQEFKRKYIESEMQLSNENSREERVKIQEQTEELVETWKTNA